MTFDTSLPFAVHIYIIKRSPTSRGLCFSARNILHVKTMLGLWERVSRFFQYVQPVPEQYSSSWKRLRHDDPSEEHRWLVSNKSSTTLNHILWFVFLVNLSLANKRRDDVKF